MARYVLNQDGQDIVAAALSDADLAAMKKGWPEDYTGVPAPKTISRITFITHDDAWSRAWWLMCWLVALVLETGELCALCEVQNTPFIHLPCCDDAREDAHGKPIRFCTEWLCDTFKNQPHCPQQVVSYRIREERSPSLEL